MTLYVVFNRVFSVWLYMECVMEYSLCGTIWSIPCVALCGMYSGVLSVWHYMEYVVEYYLCDTICCV